MPVWRLSRPYASDAAVGSLMMRRTSSPAILPASRVAVPLRVVEVRQHRNDRAIDLRIDIALGGEEFFGAALQIAKDERFNLQRRELALAKADADDARRFAGNAERKELRLAAHIVDALAHEALHGIHVCAAPRSARRRCASRPTKIVPSSVRGHDGRLEAHRRSGLDDDWRAVLYVKPPGCWSFRDRFRLPLSMVTTISAQNSQSSQS